MSQLVSVIIPNYNHGKYLKQRIESILNQTYSNIELIILDDKSQDNSLEIIYDYKLHSKVSHIVVNKENSGSTFVQWNKGFQLAKGKYIWIAESDDFCDNNMLEILVSEMDNNKDNVIAFCYSQFVDENGRMIPPFYKFSKGKKNYKGKDFISLFMVEGNVICNASSAIFRKDILNFMPSDYMEYKAAGDRLFWINLAKHGNVSNIFMPLNFFRQHKVKVSPSKMKDGTTFYEDFKIYSNLKKDGYINSFRTFFIKNHYIDTANKIGNMPNHVRDNIYKVWKYPKFIPNIIISIIDQVYHFVMKVIIKLNMKIKFS